MSFTSLPVAYAGPEGSSGSTNPLAGQTGFLAGTRKRAIDNASFQIAATGVCQLPNKSTTLGLAGSATSAILIVEAASSSVNPSNVLVRIWLDGTAPTTITGLPLYAGQPVEIIGQDDLMNCRLVSADGNQHALQIQYFSGL